MTRIGVFLAIVGFLSVILFEFTDYRLRLLSWADDYQPGIGLGFGALGVVLIVAGAMAGKKKAAAAE